MYRAGLLRLRKVCPYIPYSVFNFNIHSSLTNAKTFASKTTEAGFQTAPCLDDVFNMCEKVVLVNYLHNNWPEKELSNDKHNELVKTT